MEYGIRDFIFIFSVVLFKVDDDSDSDDKIND